MKQLAFMIAFTVLGTVGVIFNPFYGVFTYYLFAVLRPQFIWQWSLPPGINWSLYVSLATISIAILCLLEVFPPDARHPSDIRHAHRPTAGHTAFALFAVWICLTYFTALNHDAAFMWFTEYLKIFLMYFIAAYLIRTAGQVWALFLMVGLSLGYISYEINFLYFVNGYLGIHRNGYGGLDNNGAGLMLAMGAPVCYFAFEAVNGRIRWLFLLLVPAIVHAVLMTYSRGAMLSLVVVVPLAFFRSRMKIRFLGGLGLFILFMLPVLAGKEIRERFVSIQQSEIDESAQLRRASWLAAYRIAQDYPVFGVGIRNANLLSYHYGADIAGRTIHSQYLQILADNGFVGLGLYLVALGTAWWGLRQARVSVRGRKDQEAVRVRAMSAGLECTLALFCFGAIFLSLEVFELPFLVLLLAAQLPLVCGALDAPTVLPGTREEPIAQDTLVRAG
ncbi:MAG: O-antigen ligase family protein [Gemmataceae bacterium]|nr:O-antigen ligase family protein [Gemmataceae bacterium]